jgi:hypothetical protein
MDSQDLGVEREVNLESLAAVLIVGLFPHAGNGFNVVNCLNARKE